MSLPLVTPARTNGDDFAFLRLFLGGVGNDDASLRLLFPFRRRMTTRSCRGLNFMGFTLGVGASGVGAGFWHSQKKSANPSP